MPSSQNDRRVENASCCRNRGRRPRAVTAGAPQRQPIGFCRPPCFRTLATASCAMRKQILFPSSGNCLSSPVYRRAPPTGEPAVHWRAPASSAAGQSPGLRAPMPADPSPIGGLQWRLWRAILHASCRCRLARSASAGRLIATASNCEEIPTSPGPGVS